MNGSLDCRNWFGIYWVGRFPCLSKLCLCLLAGLAGTSTDNRHSEPKVKSLVGSSGLMASTRPSNQKDVMEDAPLRIEADTDLSGIDLHLEKGGVITGKVTRERRAGCSGQR